MIGICISIRTASNSRFSSISSASFPFSATVTRCPRFSNRRTATTWFALPSSASRMFRAGTFLGRSADRSPTSGLSRIPRPSTPMTSFRRLPCFTGLFTVCAIPTSSSSCFFQLPPTELIMTMGMFFHFSLLRSHLASPMPSTPGITRSTTIRLTSPSCSSHAVSLARAASPPPHRIACIPQLSRISPTIFRLDSLSSTTRTESPRRASAACGHIGPCSGATPNTPEKSKVLPCPSSLSSQISPPIFSAMRLEIASPRPVPP